MPDPDPAISRAGSVLAGSRSRLRFKRHGHGSVQALPGAPDPPLVPSAYGAGLAWPPKSQTKKSISAACLLLIDQPDKKAAPPHAPLLEEDRTFSLEVFCINMCDNSERAIEIMSNYNPLFSFLQYLKAFHLSSKE